jgi:hypothetical protein
MARKPKATSSNAFAASPEGVLAALSNAPAPVRRGRKPKAAASAEPLATMDSDDAVGGDADGSIASRAAAPLRRRPGPKPRQRAGATEAAPLQENAVAKTGRDANASHATAEPMPVADDKLDAGMDGQQSRPQQVHGHEPVTPEGISRSSSSDAASAVSSQDVATSSQPAAHWDRATDTVRFRWLEIERTAAQVGPNQVMAKLLVAARAEGANSRWPLQS